MATNVPKVKPADRTHPTTRVESHLCPAANLRLHYKIWNQYGPPANKMTHSVHGWLDEVGSSTES